MIALDTLDNSIWNALTTRHANLALQNGLAARYPTDISPLVGLAEPSSEAFANLRELVADGEQVALFTSTPIEVPRDWVVARTRLMDQMICEAVPASGSGNFERLSDADVPDMIALTALTVPGPFKARTILTGPYIGVRDNELGLVAMSGQRLSLTAAAEISAVCTHPDVRGRGYARTLVAASAISVLESGRVPFLHVKTDNVAKRVYEALGFHTRRISHLTVVSPLA